MKLLAYNSDSHLGRALFSVEADALTCTRRIGDRRIVQSVQISQIQSVYERRRERFPEASIRMAGFGVGVVSVLSWITHRLVFLDDQVFHAWVVRLYGRMFTVMVGASIAWRTFCLLRLTEHVVFKNDAGIVVTSISKNPRSAAQFERFIEELSHRIRRAREMAPSAPLAAQLFPPGPAGVRPL